jgi:hypothetical protein
MDAVEKLLRNFDGGLRGIRAASGASSRAVRSVRAGFVSEVRVDFMVEKKYRSRSWMFAGESCEIIL